MLPPHQGFGTGQLATVNVHDGLELHMQLALLHATFEIFLAGAVIGRNRARGGAIGLDAVAAEALGVIHRQLGVAQHIRRRGGIAVIDGYADRGGERQIAVAEIERSLQRLADLFGSLGNLAGGLLGRQNHRELIAGDTGNGIERAHNAGDATRNRQQHRIGSRMANALLELHEAVYIDQEHRRLDATGGLGTHQSALQPIEKQLPIGQTGKAIVHRVMQQAFARGAVFGDILQGADDTIDLAIAAQHRLHAHAEAAIGAVVAGDPHISRDLAAPQFNQRVEGGAETVAVVGMDAVEPAFDGAT